MSEPLFCYCLKIADREFLIEVSHEGVIYWDDYQEQRLRRSADERYLELQATAGDMRAQNRLSAEIDEFTVALPLSQELLVRFREAATALADGRWTTADEEELDARLESVFWAEVNPHIS